MGRRSARSCARAPVMLGRPRCHEALREFGPPLLALLIRCPTHFSSRFRWSAAARAASLLESDFMRELTDEAIAEHVKFGPRIPTVNSAVHIYAMDGAVQMLARTKPVRLPRREFVHIIAAVTPDPATLPLYRDWTQQYWRRCTLIRGRRLRQFPDGRGRAAHRIELSGKSRAARGDQGEVRSSEHLQMNQNIQPAK